MVRFLIKRPIAVSMSFLAIIILGIIASMRLPVSLLPPVAIPEITVEIERSNTSAREIENSIVKPLRQQLMQVSHLKDITSDSRNSSATINLKFDYGTNIDYAFIEVNEKIDRAMEFLPRDIKRPKVIKASASDIPIFYMNLTLKKDSLHQDLSTKNFMMLSRFASEVIRKRIEQLPEVALVDMSGLVSSEIIIIPNEKKMQSLGINAEILSNLLQENNVKMGSLVIRNGQYTYNLQLGESLNSIDEIKNLHLNVHGKIIKLEDICTVKEQPQPRKGMILSDDKQSVSLAIIKQSDSRMQDVEKSLNVLVKEFHHDYPDINFTITRNQTKLLDYSMANLGQSLFISSIFAFLVMFLFLKDYRASLLIGLSIPVSLVITILFFYLFHISLNIISLSGLVLGVGMMVDNSIIVIDNITQYSQRLGNLSDACIVGTNEVISPLFSSMLTTCAVFIPLVFAGGIAGALFYDQAMSISIGLLASFAVSITLLPVYYKLFFQRKPFQEMKFLKKINSLDYARLYEKGYYLVMRHKTLSIVVFVALIFAGFFMFHEIKKTRLPDITRDDMMLYIDWNQNIDLQQNKKFTQNITNAVKIFSKQTTAMIGEQQFVLDKKTDISSSESIIYFKAKSPQALDSIIGNLKIIFATKYPIAQYKITDAGNIFNILFADTKAPLIAELRPVKKLGDEGIKTLLNQISIIKDSFPNLNIKKPVFKTYLILKTDPELLALYKVNFNQIYNILRQKFNKYKVLTIVENNRFMPVIIGSRKASLSDIISKTFIPNNDSALIPLSKLVKEEQQMDLKNIIGGKQGEYCPLLIKTNIKHYRKIMLKMRKILKRSGLYEVDFSGSIFDNIKMMKKLIYILLVSVLLLYFILASQFESFSLPIIVLSEILVDISGAVFLLIIFGETINLMSMIGIIVMTGIVINDSILKIDTINVLIKQGYKLEDAIKEAGHRRLKPILMTSLTTILALIPFLFFKGLGADLQRPLALTIIGGLSLGTFVSLYYVPLFYYFLKRKKVQN